MLVVGACGLLLFLFLSVAARNGSFCWVVLMLRWSPEEIWDNMRHKLSGYHNSFCVLFFILLTATRALDYLRVLSHVYDSICLFFVFEM